LNNNEIIKAQENVTVNDIIFHMSNCKYRNENKHIKMIFLYEFFKELSKEYYYKKMLHDNFKISYIKEYYDILQVKYHNKLKIIFDLNKSLKKKFVKWFFIKKKKKKIYN